MQTTAERTRMEKYNIARFGKQKRSFLAAIERFEQQLTQLKAHRPPSQRFYSTDNEVPLPFGEAHLKRYVWSFEHE